MIAGIGICMLVVGLIGIVILQMVRSQTMEGFIYTGAVTPDCKLKNTDNKIANGSATESDVDDYRGWCNLYNKQCAWDEDAKTCGMNPKYKPKDPTIPDDVMDPCDRPCSQLSGDSHACMNCEKCVVCVNDDNDTPGSSSKCIDVSKYTPEKCPDTNDGDFGKASDSSPGTSGRLPQMDENDVGGGTSTKTKKTKKTKTTKKPETDYENSGSFSDDSTKITKDILGNGMNFNYVMNESNVTANAKQKNNQAKFLKDIQSIIHNEMLNQQGMTTANSQEYLRDKAQRRRENMKPNRKPGCPDMSDYVRKDSIPCWGCTLE